MNDATSWGQQSYLKPVIIFLVEDLGKKLEIVAFRKCVCRNHTILLLPLPWHPHVKSVITSVLRIFHGVCIYPLVLGLNSCNASQNSKYQLWSAICYTTFGGYMNACAPRTATYFNGLGQNWRLERNSRLKLVSNMSRLVRWRLFGLLVFSLPFGILYSFSVSKERRNP